MQLHLFPTIIRSEYLEADSPKKAFYRLMIEECQGQYTIVKESGCAGKIMDRRRWPTKNLETAEKKFNKILEGKLNPGRGSPRRYKRKRRR